MLIVDDSAFMRMVLKDKLAKIGQMEIFEASNGQQAIDEFNRGKPHLVLLDIVLPDARGDELLGELRKTGMKSRVIVVTAVGQKSMMERCEKLGISGYITKPFDDEKVTAMLRDVVRTINRSSRIKADAAGGGTR